MGFVKSVAAVLISVSAISLAMQSCTTSMCTDNRNSIPEAGFYDYATGEAANVVGVSIGGIDAPDDSLLYDNETVQLVYLPLRADAEVTSFRFHFSSDDVTDPETGEVTPDHTHDDIVTFYYSSTPYFEGEACGAILHYRIDRVDFTPNGHIADIELLDPNVTNEHKEYLKIYFHVASSDDGDDSGGDDSGSDDSGDGGDSGNPDDSGEGDEEQQEDAAVGPSMGVDPTSVVPVVGIKEGGRR
ncbi:MAG: hypothetical protein C7K11_02875 [Candidatus Amulumruptor caecigallinarius]|uniref:DUF6452 family protein n=1 Tax=Candidatus Amulumruptor caecigallinarius TaxID=2109911 RepID=A0A4V1LAH8_9BACT|nr:MAG: hypothetical protein C7K11_02875 [Candidatus Amulumruptor caecigallinarius]HJE40157.1 DUF6452 family protein [Candidatus Amulumruptor caecigallinarius]